MGSERVVDFDRFRVNSIVRVIAPWTDLNRWWRITQMSFYEQSNVIASFRSDRMAAISMNIDLRLEQTADYDQQQFFDLVLEQALMPQAFKIEGRAYIVKEWRYNGYELDVTLVRAGWKDADRGEDAATMPSR
jgi:hypothetical protein